MTNSTFSGNASTGAGGGAIDSSAATTITNSTVSANSAVDIGGGIDASGRSRAVTLRNTIVAGNTSGLYGLDTYAPVDSPINSAEHNLIGDVTGATGFIASDLLDRNPLLGPLQNNGGNQHPRPAQRELCYRRGLVHGMPVRGPARQGAPPRRRRQGRGGLRRRRLREGQAPLKWRAPARGVSKSTQAWVVVSLY